METKKVAKEYLQKDILRTIFQMWYSFYTTEIGKERKAAIEDMRFERDGWLHIEPWEIWLELTEHPEMRMTGQSGIRTCMESGRGQK